MLCCWQGFTVEKWVWKKEGKREKKWGVVKRHNRVFLGCFIVIVLGEQDKNDIGVVLWSWDGIYSSFAMCTKKRGRRMTTNAPPELPIKNHVVLVLSINFITISVQMNIIMMNFSITLVLQIVFQKKTSVIFVCNRLYQHKMFFPLVALLVVPWFPQALIPIGPSSDAKWTLFNPICKFCFWNWPSFHPPHRHPIDPINLLINHPLWSHT